MSGDLVGGALAGALQLLRPEIKLWGIGSRHMERAGVELLYDSAQWSAIGVVEALKAYPMLRFRAYPQILRQLQLRQPKAVVLIDFGAFNVKVAHWCKARGVPVLYYFPPGSWRRTGRVRGELARITDRIATPFPWSAERLQQVGANVAFVGHPLLEIVRPTLTREQFADRFGMDAEHPIVGLLPGSRRFEVTYNFPAMLGAAQRLSGRVPGVQFVVGLASPVARQIVEDQLQRLQEQARRAQKAAERAAALREHPKDREKAARRADPLLVTPEGVTLPADVYKEWRGLLTHGADPFAMPAIVLADSMTYDVMAHSDALLVCSGTATLEAAILSAPMVILYRGSRLMEMEAKLRRVRPAHIGMPNIIAGERIVPEFIQHDAHPETLAQHTLTFLTDMEARARVRQALGRVREALGAPGASRRVAEMICEMIR
jgi:lipid-A-disaccharide synthase